MTSLHGAPQSRTVCNRTMPCFLTMHYYIVTFMLMCAFVPARTDDPEGRARSFYSEMEPWNTSSATKSVSQFLMVFGGNSGQLGEAPICRISTWLGSFPTPYVICHHLVLITNKALNVKRFCQQVLHPADDPQYIRNVHLLSMNHNIAIPECLVNRYSFPSALEGACSALLTVGEQYSPNQSYNP